MKAQEFHDFTTCCNIAKEKAVAVQILSVLKSRTVLLLRNLSFRTKNDGYNSASYCVDAFEFPTFGVTPAAAG